VQRERDKPPPNLRDGCSKEKFPGVVLQEMVGNEDKDTKIVGLDVMIQEASWESSEELVRRRQLYAVLAALNHLGYAPDDAEKLHAS